MTHSSNDHETPASLLAPLARGLLRRSPDILSLSIHDGNGHALWSSGDFLLAEDHALIAEVVEESSTEGARRARARLRPVVGERRYRPRTLCLVVSTNRANSAACCCWRSAG